MKAEGSKTNIGRARRVHRPGQVFERAWALGFLAALGLPSPAFCLGAATPAATDIRGIVPPQPFFVGGTGLAWLAVGVLSLLLVAFILWEVLRTTRRPATPPLSPRETAARRLRELEARMDGMDARTFGGAVCDVLRAYIGGEFGLAAERQTSPEFLASISGNRAFSVREHHVLAEFLEACDLLKFARAEATADRKRHLLAQATEFLEFSSRPPAPENAEARMQNAEAGTL